MIVGVFMNSTDRLLLSKLERALQKKHTKTHGSPVNIKDILVIQSFKDEGAGMFRRLVGETISIAEMTGTESHPDPEDETRDQLLGRMETHIRDQLTLANQTHLADNFTGQDKTHLKAGAENNITRLSFSEFSFYPKSLEGPLSIEEFDSLIGEVEKIAMGYHKNLHILLSSFPVKDPRGNVHNVICYVQCGSEPKIDVFAKAIPSRDDPQYPETRNPSVLKGSINRHLGPKIWDMTKKIKDDFTKQNIDAIRENVVQVRLMATEDPDFLATPALIDSLDMLSSQLKDPEYRPTQEDIKTVLKELDLYETQISRDSEAYFNRDNLGEFVPMGTLSNGTLSAPSPSLGWRYGGQVVCETEGGAQFTTAIDICMDHQYAVAKHVFSKMAKLNALSAEGLIPTQASQIVTSNTTSLIQKNFLAASIVHADSCHDVAGIMKDTRMPSLEAVSETVNQKQAFGFSSVTRILPSQPLDLLPGNLAHTIKEQNNFNIKVEARRMFYDQFPGKRDAIKEEFIEFFATEVLSRCKYSHMLTEKEREEHLDVLRASPRLSRLDIKAPTIGASLSSEIEKIEQDITVSNPSFKSIVDLQEKNEKKEEAALIIIKEAIKKCQDWPFVNPGEQKKASSKLMVALINDARLNVLKPLNVNGLIDEISQNLSDAIYKKGCGKISIRHRGNNMFGLHLGMLCAKPFVSTLGEQQNQTPSAKIKQDLLATLESSDSSANSQLNSGCHHPRRN